MAPAECLVSVVAPLANDADIVDAFVLEITDVLRRHYSHYELVLVDDGSTDGTEERVAALLGRLEGIRLLRLSRKFGQEIAISAGLDSAIGDFVVVMLPNLDPPGLVPAMVDEARNGAGIVFAIRRSRRREPIVMRLGYALFYWYSSRFLKLSFPRNVTHFRVFSRQAVNALLQIKDRQRYLQTSIHHVGLRHRSFPYDAINRRGRAASTPFVEAVSLALSIMVVNSTQPLRFVSWLGLLLSFLNLAYIGYLFSVYVLGPPVAEGWVTLALQHSAMSFFQFLFLAVVSEYVGRMLNEIRGRPLYYVLEERNSSVVVANQDRRNVVSEAVDG